MRVIIVDACDIVYEEALHEGGVVFYEPPEYIQRQILQQDKTVEEVKARMENK